MKFIVDAHIPQAICYLLNNSGHDAVHTLELPQKNDTDDIEINKISVREKRVVITMDTDFYYSFIAKQQPYKLLLLKTGNISTRDLMTLFTLHFNQIIDALKSNSIVELDYHKVSPIL